MGELISEVRVFPVNHDKLKANASITVAGAFAVKVKVVETAKGLMVQMPSQSYVKDGETKYSDLAFPVTKEAREEMIDKVLAKYKEEIGDKSSSSSAPSEKKDKVPF